VRLPRLGTAPQSCAVLLETERPSSYILAQIPDPSGPDGKSHPLASLTNTKSSFLFGRVGCSETSETCARRFHNSCVAFTCPSPRPAALQQSHLAANSWPGWNSGCENEHEYDVVWRFNVRQIVRGMTAITSTRYHPPLVEEDRKFVARKSFVLSAV
jgi:hypothetical protein